MADKSSSDKLTFVHDQKLYQVEEDKLHWPGSRAEKACHEDIKAGKHKTMKPKKLQQTNNKYKKWLLEHFQNHIYQEQSREVSSPDWK